MTLSQLRHFQSIAKYRNFSHAAAVLYMSQPALTKSIRTLEEELCLKLIDRSTHPITLTKAGQIFLEKSEQILFLSNELKESMDLLASNAKKKIYLGIPGERGSTWLPHLLPAVQKNLPQIDIHIIEGNSRTLEEKLIAEEIDICLYTMPVYNPDINYIVLADDPIVFAAAKGHPLSQYIDLAHNSPRTPQMLLPAMILNEPFITLVEGSGMRRMALSIFDRHHLNPNFILELNRHETAVRLAASGIGLVVTPSITPIRLGIEGSLIYFTLDNPVISRQIIIAYKRGTLLSPEAGQIIALTQQLIRDLPQLTVQIERIIE